MYFPSFHLTSPNSSSFYGTQQCFFFKATVDGNAASEPELKVGFSMVGMGFSFEFGRECPYVFFLLGGGGGGVLGEVFF